jgi:hypothetical protein
MACPIRERFNARIDGDLSAKVVLDIPCLDSVWRILLNNLKQI